MNIKNKHFSVPIIQGGMGVGVSLSGLAGAVAKCGGVGVISSVNAGYREKDFESNPLNANLRALDNEIKKAKTISEGNGLVAVNIMTAVSNYEKTCRCAVDAGADIIISGAGLPLDLPAYTKGTDTLCAPIVSSGRAARILIKHYMRHYQVKPDMIVIEGNMAGGHLGFSEEELLNGTVQSNDDILIDVLKEAGDIPVFVAGGVFDGKGGPGRKGYRRPHGIYGQNQKAEHEQRRRLGGVFGHHCSAPGHGCVGQLCAGCTGSD